MFDNQENILLEDAKLIFIPQFFTPSVSDQFLTNLTEIRAWQQGEITMFGKRVLEPRLTAWYGDEGKSYTYSGKKQEPIAWDETLLLIKNEIEKTLLQKNYVALFSVKAFSAQSNRNSQI